MTLVELMVAMTIGLLLILGVMQIFSASRSAYQLSAGLARVQENGRFALDFLQRDLRMVGHFGCVNDQAHTRLTPSTLTTTFAAVPHPALLFSESIQGFEADDTGPGGELTLSATPATGGTDYTPALPAEFAADLDNRIDGSDIVVLRYLAPEGVPVTNIAGTLDAPQFLFDATRLAVLQSGVTDPGLFGVADCKAATVFQAGAVSAGAVNADASAPNNAATFSSVFTAGQTMIYRAETIIYYVGLNGNGNGMGQGSLYRLRYQATPSGALVPQKEELVEGVENMQILYGQDRVIDPALPPTGYIDKQEVAGDIEASATLPADGWRRVGSVQLGLVLASPEVAAASQADADGDSALNALGVTFTLPSDGHYRSVYQTTIALRNRLYGN
ncbi:MAG TPA: PilW family protein [Stenotrophomonas sp.]